MAAARGKVTREEITAYIKKTDSAFKDSGTVTWADVVGSGKVIDDDVGEDANRIQKVTLISPLNRSASTDEETQDYYGDDEADTVATTSDITIDPVEFTGQLDYSDDTKTDVLDAKLGTKYQVALAFKTGGEDEETVRAFLGTLTRTQEDPAATGISTVLLGFNVRNGVIHRLDHA